MGRNGWKREIFYAAVKDGERKGEKAILNSTIKDFFLLGHREDCGGVMMGGGIREPSN